MVSERDNTENRTVLAADIRYQNSSAQMSLACAFGGSNVLTPSAATLTTV